MQTPLIIDVEASGFGAVSYPIEVGIALESDKRFCSLIIPADDWTHWDESAEQVHHISRSTLHSCGNSLTEVANKLNSLLKNKTVYSDGWVVDKPWLIKLFHAAQVKMQFEVSQLELILTEYQMAHWYETRDQVIDDSNLTRHRASNDAWIIQETYKRTLLQQAS